MSAALFPVLPGRNVGGRHCHAVGGRDSPVEVSAGH
jgi:hypothetical protein